MVWVFLVGRKSDWVILSLFTLKDVKLSTCLSRSDFLVMNVTRATSSAPPNTQNHPFIPPPPPSSPRQILKPADKKKLPYTGIQGARPVTPPKGGAQPKGKGKM